ncbi:hypothetical protein E2986_10336 [Frieseomelitta varia]|uniref:FAM234A/B beta-propeller domain-containing protein n=1 Tax=Frieseomelitta varia TaxID=561572 RepID=A0A833VV02_9HYME|nr:uncharacterized protein LOC122536863 [Frieseomelitta varia]KAF3421304.1 hypothetical protein E2986_10336 [Frieseomelitta varia]
MSVVYPILPKLVERDGFDDEDLTDIDDEVFIRDGKNGLKLHDDRGVKRPLMAPRRKYKRSYNFETYGLSNKASFGLMVLIILSLIILCMYIVNIIPGPISVLKNWLSDDLKNSLHESNIIPCTSLVPKILWTKSLPKLISESPIRSNDVNGDGVEDIIIGFSTGLDMINIPEYICALYFDGQVPCSGGILALNGKTGDILWVHWTAHAVFSIDCGIDLTNDKIKDCIICGRGGILHAVDGYNGTSIWEIPVQDLSISEEWKLSDIYDAKFIADIDGDDIGDIIASHTIQSKEIHSSEILMISGINGNIIHRSVLPNTEQLFLAPQKLVHPDGENIFVLVTSSQKQSGGLYVISQENLMYNDLKLRKLHHNTGKGTLLPPILVDVTLDGIEDIVAAMFNSTIIVYNGLTFEPIWNYTVPNSEVISIPIPGYYNDDNIPDFMVKHQIGLGFPTYYYTVATIIDGKTGKPLLEKPIEDSLSREMSGLSVTVEGFGNDWFLHWSVDCLNYEGIKEKYQFLKSEDFISESRADICKLRFNSTLITNLYALSQHVGPPGISLYFSEDWKSLEYNNSMNVRIELPFITESSKNHKDKNKKNSFEQKLKDSYETYEQYNNEHKKFAPIDSQNNVLENGNKWPPKNIQTNKYFDILYDENNKINIQDQPIDYQQENEVREQRSNFNLEFTYQFDNRINNSIKNTYNNETNITNSKINTFETFDDYIANLDAKNNDVETFTNKIFNNVPKQGKNVIIKKILRQKFLKNRNEKGDTDIKPKLKLKDKFETKLKKQKKKREIKLKSNQIYAVHGIQRQPPTGILLPSILETKGITSIDLIFSTFWLPSSKASVILVQEDLNCIHWKMLLSEKKFQYKDSDDIIKECLDERGVNYKIHQETSNGDDLKISLGQMTIYRMKLVCMCPEDMLPNQSCRNISMHQSWPEYLGSGGNGYFKPFYKTNF